LGLYDMTGELMRFAITTMATSHRTANTARSETSERTVLSDMRELRYHLEMLQIPYHSDLSHEVPKKMSVMQTSVEKVEKAFYGLTVRGAERPSDWVPDVRDSRMQETD
jgi:predicted translin family RNA/ssDNA-binding protein